MLAQLQDQALQPPLYIPVYAVGRESGLGWCSSKSISCSLIPAVEGAVLEQSTSIPQHLFLNPMFPEATSIRIRRFL